MCLTNLQGHTQITKGPLQLRAHPGKFGQWGGDRDVIQERDGQEASLRGLPQGPHQLFDRVSKAQSKQEAAPRVPLFHTSFRLNLTRRASHVKPLRSPVDEAEVREELWERSL